MTLGREKTAPIPGFSDRLRRAIARKYSSVTGCAIALGLRDATLSTWLHERTKPWKLESLEVLSTGLKVSIDDLVLGEGHRLRESIEGCPGRTFHARLRWVLLERYGKLADAWRALGVRRHVGSSWIAVRGDQRKHPHLAYTRAVALNCRVSIDWLWRGEPWATTTTRRELNPSERASVLARRALEGMADRQDSEEIANELRYYAHRRVFERRKRLPSPDQLVLPMEA